MTVVGIDLGTTNTVSAAYVGDQLRVFRDEEGRSGLPSVVSFMPSGAVVVGRKAKERRWQDPRNTVLSHKRFIGRAWNSPDLEQGRKQCAFELRQGPSGSTMVHSRGKDYTLPEISAFVLKRALEIATYNLGKPPEQAVITVPAHFNELQRASTKIAGRVSGVDVLRILNEPTAAALAYGLAEANGQRICVYDFGGGTFDCTILDVHDNVFEVIGTAGDTFLGGDDADNALAYKMAEALLATHRYDARTDPAVFERLRATGEEVKIALSTQEAARVMLRGVAIGVGGKELDLEFRISRAEFEQLIGPLVERTVAVTADALKLAELAPSALDKIILVGGSTRMPFVAKRLAKFFGRAPMCTMNPEEVVAMGAAISASSLSAGTRKPIPAPLAPVNVRQTQVGVSEAPSGTIAPPGIPAPPPVPAHPFAERHPFAQAHAFAQPASPQAHAFAQPASPQAHAFAQPASPQAHPFAQPASPQAPPSAPSLPVEPPASGSMPPLKSVMASQSPPPLVALPQGPALPLLVDPDMPEIPQFSEFDEPTVSDVPSLPPMTIRGQGMAGPALPPPSSRTLVMDTPQEQQRQRPAPPPQQPPPPRARAHQPPTPQAAPPAAQLQQLPRVAGMPVLVDVTPRALVVEVAGGFCDTVIPRNAKIPCAMRRSFSTAQDNQTAVRIRVGQGEAPQFAANTYLGEIELSGIAPGPRGTVGVEVMFQLDQDGRLRVAARDPATGRATNAVISLVGAADESAIAAMQARVAGTQVHRSAEG